MMDEKMCLEHHEAIIDMQGDIKWIRKNAEKQNGTFAKHITESNTFRHQVTRNTVWRHVYKAIFGILLTLIGYIIVLYLGN